MKDGTDKEFLEYVAKAIVDHPEDVKVDRKVDEMGVLLSLNVNPADMGQVVGKRGATAQALRSLLRIVGVKNNSHVNLKIEEPEGSTFRRPSAPGLPGQGGTGETSAAAAGDAEDEDA